MTNFLSPTFWGSFFAIFGDFRGVNVKFCVFDPQKALPYPKRHLSVYFMKLSDKRCRLHPSSRTPKGEKMPSRLYMLGICRTSDPLCKCYETWHGGSCRVRNRSDRCWSTPVNRFRCVATPKLGPFHWQGPSGLLHCGSRYRGNAWFINFDSKNSPSTRHQHPAVCIEYLWKFKFFLACKDKKMFALWLMAVCCRRSAVLYSEFKILMNVF